MIRLDVNKPYSSIHGICTTWPGAKYQQGKLIFDAGRQCLNPEVAENDGDNTVAADATAAVKKVLQDRAEASFLKLEAAKKRLDAEATPAAKSAYTKAANAYQKDQEDLEQFLD